MASLKIVVNHMRNDYNPMLKLKTLIPVFMKPQCGFRYSMFGNPSFKAIVEHPNEVYPLLKLDIAMKNAEKQIRITEPHWRFCYSILHKVSTMSVLLVQQLDSSECRDAACILYLFFRALDTVEDDTTIPDEVKIPILKDFHRHIYDRDFRITCGTKERRVLMDNLHQVSTAFLELNESYQEAIENIIMRMGAGMAKFMDKEIETLEEYDEYCYIVGPLTILGFSKLFHASGTEILLTDSFSLSSGFLPLKIDVIKDFLEDINETPKSRCHWPREIWSKYTNNLEDLKYEENSEKAIQCLNDMVTNSLLHIDGAFEYLTQLRDPGAFRFFAILEVISIGEIALCYNNIQVFRGPMILRPGLMAQIFDRTRTMSDVYGAFYEFCSILKSKVNMSDPNAKTTISRIEAVQKTCRDSGTLDKWKPYVFESQPSNNRGLIAFFIITVAVFYAYLSPNYRPNQIKTMWPASASSVENVGNKRVSMGSSVSNSQTSLN